jgi:hypothetical protein
MAGFLDKGRGKTSGKLAGLSKFGNRYEDLLLKNSQAIGFIESQIQARSNRLGSNSDDLLKFSMAIADTTSQLRTKAIAFFQLDYIVKRERLRDIASNGEIEFIIETIVDDMIVYDESNRFCSSKDVTGKMMFRGETKEDRLNYQKSVIDKYHDNFEKIYNAWGFAESVSAWQYAFQFLVEGHLAFEILYDNLDKPTTIIGFKELDPASIAPQLQKDAKGKMFMQWIQYDQQSGGTRVLNDSQIIYISYANHFRTKRVSFVERLIRSFNLLRIIEHSKVIWHSMNAPIRLTTTVPTGTKSYQKAQEDVREFTNLLKEDIYFNGDTGELQVDGKPNIMFYKNYILPVNDQNQAVKIEPLQFPGPNLSGSELLNYFYKKLKMDSKIPYSRWEGQSGMGAFTLNAEGITREEIRYQKFVRRLRTAYSELLVKPWYLQMCLDIPDLADDHKFNNALGLSYHNDNVFEEMKEQEVDAKRVAAFTAKKGILKDDGTPYYHTEYLVRTELKMTADEIEANKEWFNRDEEVVPGEPGKPPSAGGGAPPAGGGAAAPPAAPETPPAAPAETTEGGETAGAGQL